MKQWSSWRSVTAAVFALSLSHSLAQQWQAELPTVEKAGVYLIALSPEMVGRSKENLGDVRLVDTAGTEVPYVMEIADPGVSTTVSHEFVITRNAVLGKETIVELSRPSPGSVVDDIHLRIRNAEVQKDLTLTGSDDGRQWFFIKQTRLSLASDGSDRTTTLRMVALPPSDYASYRLSLNDSASSPVQVLGAEWYSSSGGQGSFAEDVTAVPLISDSAKATRIRIRHPYPIALNRLQFLVGDTGSYLRPGRVITWATHSSGRRSKRRTWREMDNLFSFTLRSDQPSGVDVPALRLDTFDIVIDNGDDRTLHISDVRFLQLQRTLTAELQPGMRYTLTTGDPKRSPPRYDIVHFKDKLPEPIATIAHGPLIALPVTPEAGPSSAPSRWWIWAGLVAVLGIVGFTAVRMLREPLQPNG
jgi:hypothetical protein